MRFFIALNRKLGSLTWGGIMIVGTFRYFALGRDYSPLRGCIACDAEGRGYMVTPDDQYIPAGINLEDCERRVRYGRMVETTRQDVEQQNGAWLRLSQLPAFEARVNSY